MKKQKLRGKIIDIISDKNGFFICKFDFSDKENIPLGGINNIGTYGIVKGFGTDFHKGLELNLDGVWEENKFIAQNQFAKKYTPLLVFMFKHFEVIGSINNDLILKEFFIKNIPFVGPKTAEIIFKNYNGDQLIKILSQEDNNKIVSDLMKIQKIGMKIAKGIGKGWKELMGKRESLVGLFKIGLSIKQAERVFNTFGEESLEKIKENPFVLTSVKGIGLSQVEKLNEKMGYSKENDFRYASIVEHFIRESSSQDSLISKENIEEHVKNYLLNTNEFNKSDEVIERGIKKSMELGTIKKINQNIFILSSLEIIEKNVFKKMEMMKDLEDQNYNDSIIDSIKDINYLTKEQKESVKKSLKYNLSFLIGPAGSGKTTATKFIIEGFKKKGKKICIITPTHKAAKRVKEVNSDTSIEVSTLHKLLGIKPDVKKSKYGNGKYLPYDVIIVDESSMIGIYNIYQLFKSIKNETSILFIGDKNQLASIESGSFLNDVVNSERYSKNLTELTVVKRVDNTNLGFGEVLPNMNNIIANSQLILDGKRPKSTQSNSYVSIYSQIEDEEIEKIKSQIKGLYNKMQSNNIDVHKDFQILIPTYKSELGINKLNEYISSFINCNKVEKIENKKFKLGDKVFYDSKNEELGLVKGDTGVIKKIDKNLKKFTIEFFGIGVCELSFMDVSNLSLGYCMSVHKSQGSEYKYVLIILTSHSYSLLSRNLLYTGYTRGKQKVYLIGDNFAISKSLKETESEKNTLLYHLLIETPIEDIDLVKDRGLVQITPEEIKYIKNYLNKKMGIEGRLVKIRNKKVRMYNYIYGTKEELKKYYISEKKELGIKELEEIYKNKNIFFYNISSKFKNKRKNIENHYIIYWNKDDNSVNIQ